MASRREFVKTTLAATWAISAPNLVFASPKKSESEFNSNRISPAFFALNRLAFGPRAEDLESFRSLDHWVDEQLHPEHLTDLQCDEKLKQAQLSTLSKPLKKLWEDHWLKAEEMKDSGKKGGENQLRHQPVLETTMATWIRAVYSKKQLQELLADFWHNHFSVFGFDNHIAPVFVHYDRDVIRKHLLGNFRAMLGDVARSPAMLFYLDNFLNQSGNPNENYARELFELHTLGAENYLGTEDRESVKGFHGERPIGYVDGDVYEAARCFTGWRIDQGKNSTDTGEFNYYEQWHDRFQKIVLGKPIHEYNAPMKDGETVLDLVAFHPGTSRFIARKLCRRFVSDHPSDALVEKVAAVFFEKRNAQDQIRQTLKTLFSSSEFKKSSGQKMKRPFEIIVSMLRATGADFSPTEPFLNHFKKTGQELFAWRTPDGYPDLSSRWGGTASMLERWRLAHIIAHGKPEGVSLDVQQMTPSSLTRPQDWIGYWSKRLVGPSLSHATEAALQTFLNEAPNPRERLPELVALILASPEFQLR